CASEFPGCAGAIGRMMPNSTTNVFERNGRWAGFAVFCYFVSAQAFDTRDPLSTSVGWNAYVQLCFVFVALVLAAILCLRNGLISIPPSSFWCLMFCGAVGLISSGRSYWPPLTLVKGGLFCGVILFVALLCSSVSAATVLRSLYWSVITVFSV